MKLDRLPPTLMKPSSRRFRCWRPQARTEALLLGCALVGVGGPQIAHWDPRPYLHSLNCNPKLRPPMPEPWTQPLYNKSIVVHFGPSHLSYKLEELSMLLLLSVASN